MHSAPANRVNNLVYSDLVPRVSKAVAKSKNGLIRRQALATEPNFSLDFQDRTISKIAIFFSPVQSIGYALPLRMRAGQVRCAHTR